MTEKNRLNVADNIALSGEQLNKWVVNIAKLKLTKDETAVLAKGLNFAVAPKMIPHDEFIVATKLTAIELIKQRPNKDTQVADELRSEVVDVFSKCQPPKHNLSNNERKQISSLAKRKDLLVLPADKGKASVVVDTQEYNKIKAMLTDERVYKRLKKSRTSEMDVNHRRDGR